MDKLERGKLIVSTVIGAVGSIIGRVPETVIALVLLTVLDIVSGLIAGGRNGLLSSKVSARGMARKGQMFIIVLMVAVLERYSGLDLPFSLVSAVALFYCAHEAFSIIENAAEAGLPIPDVLRHALSRLNSQTPDRRNSPTGNQQQGA